MAEPESMPLWMKMFQQEILRRLDEITADIKDMVTKDAFTEEKNRVNSELNRMSKEIAELRTALEKESQARQAAELAQAAKARDEAEARQRVQAATNWQWFLLIAVPVVGYLADWILKGGLP